jgi:hypothetical protein
MNFDRMFNPQGLNWWIIVSGIGMNFVLMTFLVLGVVYAAETGINAAVSTTAMSVGGFLIPFLTAYVCGRMGDERFLAYAFYPLVGYLMPVLFGLTSAGVFGILMIVFGVLGAFNGASIAARRANRRKHYMGDDEQKT